MNFVAIIGIVENKDVQTKNNSIITVKVEKPFVENENDEWYELIKCEINNEDFKQEIEKLKKGDIVGIKGRIQSYKNFQNILSERIQIF